MVSVAHLNRDMSSHTALTYAGEIRETTAYPTLRKKVCAIFRSRIFKAMRMEEGLKISKNIRKLLKKPSHSPSKQSKETLTSKRILKLTSSCF
jgi:hypothetical protein